MTVTPRERILDAADHIFGSIGFDAATTREIAERSGVNKALIHYYFKSKDGLLADLLEGYYARLTETLSAILLRPTGSLRERVGDLVGGYLDFLHANRNFVRIVHREASGGHHMDLVADRTLPLFELGRERRLVVVAFACGFVGRGRLARIGRRARVVSVVGRARRRRLVGRDHLVRRRGRGRVCRLARRIGIGCLRQRQRGAAEPQDR